MPAKKGIELETLIGISKVKCKRIEAVMGNRKGTEEKIPILVVEVLEGDQQGLQAKYGIVTDQALKAVLLSGKADDDGNIIMELPEPTTTGLDTINWVNFM